MGELITILGLIKDIPAVAATILVIFAILAVLYMRMKDADIQGSLSISKAQNEKLLALMQQNEQLLESVDRLQEQVHKLHKQISDDAQEHRLKMEQTYKNIDEMRNRIIELEDLVRLYQQKQTKNCEIFECPHRKK